MVWRKLLTAMVLSKFCNQTVSRQYSGRPIGRPFFLSGIDKNMYFRLILLLMLVVSATRAGADEYQPYIIRPYIVVQSVSYSEPMAIKSMLGDWQAPFKKGNKAFTYNKAETGIRWGNWQLGILNRVDYQLEFSSETAELIYLTENRLPLEVGREYELRIKALHNYSRGLRLAYQHKFSSRIKAGLAASYLQGKAFTDGSIQGRARVLAEKDYDFQFDTDYFYSRDVLFERDVTSPNGNGYSLDFSFDWQPNKLFRAQIDIVDLVGKMFWDNAPFTTAVASSATQTFDEEGYVRYNPAIRGTESNRNFTQVLPRKIFIATRYQWSPGIELLAELQDYKVSRFTSLGAGWCYNQHNCFQSLYNTTAKALLLRFQGNRLRVELASDKLDLDQARYFSFQLSFNQVF